MLVDIVGNIFHPDNFHRGVYSYLRSYSTLFIYLFHLLSFKLTPTLALNLTRITGVFTIIIFFFFSKNNFKSKISAFSIILIFLSYPLVQNSLSSIEYTIFSGFFVILSFFYIHKNKIDLALLSASLAIYFRYELAIILGIPLLIYLLANKISWKKAILFSLFISFMTLSLVSNDFIYGDKGLNGYDSEERSFFGLITNSFSLAKQNLIINKQITNGPVTKIFPIALISAFYFLISGILKRKFEIYQLISLYYLSYIFLLLFLNSQGLYALPRYGFNIFHIEVFLIFLLFSFIFSFIFNKLKSKIYWFHLFLALIIICFIPGISLYPPSIVKADHVEDYLYMKDNFIPNETCHIIKVYEYQPNLPYYYGLEDKTIMFGAPPDFYKNLFEYKKKGCFYYHEENLPEKYYQDSSFRINMTLVDKSFIGCNKTLEFEGIRSKIYKYNCKE